MLKAFVLPSSLMAQLEARRARQRAERGDTSKRSNTPGLIQKFISHFGRPQMDTRASALEFVSDMNSLQSEVEDEHDAFLIHPGMGPMTYLTRDGRVLQDFRTWDGDGVVEVATEDRAISCLVAGAKCTGISELLDLLPHRPHDALVCPQFAGRRWSVLIPGMEHPTVCALCFGRGWATQACVDEDCTRDLRLGI